MNHLETSQVPAPLFAVAIAVTFPSAFGPIVPTVAALAVRT